MSVPVLQVASMREWEAATWATGQTEAEVIRRVGEQVAQRARGLTREQDRILILAGKGHNGDDARAAREYLTDLQVELLDLRGAETDLERLQAALAKRPALIVDGLFGIGLNRPLSAAWQHVIATVNAARRPVLAVDVPSGLNADTGETHGAAVEATITLTVGAPKTGLLTAAAWPMVGRLEVAADVGLIPCPLTSDMQWTGATDFADFPPRRPAAGHKGSFGQVGILAGSLGYHGAAVLATRGAQRAQPGLTTLFTPAAVYPVVAAQLQSALVQVWPCAGELPDRLTALLVGPGLVAPESEESLRTQLQQWWRELAFPVVVDASGLDRLTAGPAASQAGRVITPHPGEAGRLLQWTTERVQQNRVTAVRELSRKYGNCWVVLKGHQTLIGRDQGKIFINSSGNPQLAQGGSGDVLAGFIAGLLAQPALQADLATTLRYAVWQHGAAADRLAAARRNWIIEELADEIGNVH